MTSAEWGVRAARPGDVAAIHGLVRELATYEREPDAVLATADDLHQALFGDPPVAHALVAELAGEIVGMAVWFVTYSTWRGRPGVWLEDLFVRPTARGTG